MRTIVKVIRKNGTPHNVVQYEMPGNFEEARKAWGEDLLFKMACQQLATSARNHAATMKTKEEVIVYDPTSSANVPVADDDVAEFLAARGIKA